MSRETRLGTWRRYGIGSDAWVDQIVGVDRAWCLNGCTRHGQAGQASVVFEQFDTLAVGESLVLINNHDPRQLREQFETDLPGSSAGTTSSGDLSGGRSGSPGSPRQQLMTEVSTLALRPGILLWLPRLSRREIAAGELGLTYLTAHPRAARNDHTARTAADVATDHPCLRLSSVASTRRR